MQTRTRLELLTNFDNYYKVQKSHRNPPNRPRFLQVLQESRRLKKSFQTTQTVKVIGQSTKARQIYQREST